jgi:hypothetical protein
MQKLNYYAHFKSAFAKLQELEGHFPEPLVPMMLTRKMGFSKSPANSVILKNKLLIKDIDPLA